MPRQSKLIGRHIVSDRSICHGQPTFRGTRILVADVLDQVASGLASETIHALAAQIDTASHRVTAHSLARRE